MFGYNVVTCPSVQPGQVLVVLGLQTLSAHTKAKWKVTPNTIIIHEIFPS